jgi:gliding motility-associated-like protein
MIEVSQSGLSWARVAIQDCEGADTIHINRGDTLRIIDTTLCFGVPYYAGQNWQTSAGVFMDTLAVPVNCVKYHETHLNYYLRIPFGYGRDTTLCSENLILKFFLAGGRYLWQDGSTDSVYTITKPGLYWVRTEYDHCSRQDTISVHDCPAFLLFPNAFTPNNDGLNDTFRPNGSGVEKFTMSIYNRWGAMIFETDAMEAGWDGTIRGQMCPEGTYIYTATYEGVTGEKRQAKGTVQLIRGTR